MASTGVMSQSNSVACRFGVMAAVAIMTIGLCGQSLAATKVEKTFGAWLVTCIEDNGAKRCSMSQQRMTEKAKQVVFVWIIGSTATKELVNNLTVPSAVSIKEGIRVSIGAKPQIMVPYDVCLQGRCVGKFPLDAAVLQTMSSSASATATYVLASRKLMQIQVDLKDFPKAYEYFKSQL
jgi:invasion protein IalB